MNRVVLITGATGKIGRVLVRHFLDAGDEVVATSRSAESLAGLAAEHAERAPSLRTLVADLEQADGARTVIEGLQRMGCHPDGLINNARNVAHLRVGEGGEVARQDFVNEFVLDVVAPYELIMALADVPGSRLKSVVNIGSMYGAVAANIRLYDDFRRQSPLHYGVAKAALAHLTRELAVRLAERRIKVNCVAFGGVEGRVDEAFKQRYAALSPMGRMLGEHELAGPIDLLLSDASSGMTGHVMMVDGGWSIW